MRLRKILLIALLLPLLSACASRHQNTTAASPSAFASKKNAPYARANSAYSILVDVSGGNDASAEPLQLMTTQSVSGTLEIKKQGTIAAFNVQIGNYHNTSDGTLVVKLCDGDVCSEGSASVDKSADNRYLGIPFQHPIDVAAGQTLHYSLTRTAGNNPLVVWTYASGTAMTTAPNGVSEARALKIGLSYVSGNKFVLAVEIAVALSLFAWLALRKLSFRVITVAGMLFAAGLILAMIVVTGKKTSVHPDEFSHVAAYQYYVNHLLPPAVNSPATIPSTSIWGFSYLFELDVVYDVAARMTGQIRELTLDNALACRLFQFCLWMILCILAMCRRRWAAILCVVLLTPQVWYVFSYFNADAFPLFLSLIAAGLVSNEENGLHKFIKAGEMRGPSMWIAALCVGMILVSKSNYLPVIPAFVLWLAVVHLNVRARFVVSILVGLLILGIAVMLRGVLGGVSDFAHWYVPMSISGCLVIVTTSAYVCWQYWKNLKTRHVLLRLAGFAILCLVVAMPRIAWDVHVNGWPAQKAASIHAVEEARAGYDFKPSTIAQHKGYPTMGLASRGVSIEHVAFAPYNWTSTSLASAFGVYGYMNIYAPGWMYWAMYGITALLILLSFYSVRVSRPHDWNALAVIVVGASLLVLASSLLFSWVFTLEPQGRYWFPILPLIVLLISQGVNGWRRQAFALLIGAAVVVSAGSFCFFALPAFV